MKDMIKEIEKIGIVPVVVLDDVKDAVPLAKALCNGGLPCAEVTFRTAAAAESIAQMVKEYPQMLVGAGTVLTKEQVDLAIEAGAKFIVSPAYDQEIVDYCKEKNILFFPAIATPSEALKAIKSGMDYVKFFPAEQAGGLAMIKAMTGPYTELRFMPTGGINAKNVKEYLAFEKIIACGGSWMVNNALVKEGAFDKIEELVREAAGIVKEIRG